jgi:hypothetical protein
MIIGSFLGSPFGAAAPVAPATASTAPVAPAAAALTTAAKVAPAVRARVRPTRLVNPYRIITTGGMPRWNPRDPRAPLTNVAALIYQQVHP